jgi:hypothetical protein
MIKEIMVIVILKEVGVVFGVIIAVSLLLLAKQLPSNWNFALG